MKKRFISLFLLGLGITANTPIYAKEMYDIAGEKTVTVEAGRIVEGDYLAAGERVEISGTIKGDVYVVGGQLLINGTVEGDLLAAGGQITMNGTVEQDVRVVAGQIFITGAVGQNLTIGGGSVEIAKEAVLGGNVTIGGGNVTIAAPVPGDVKLMAGNVLVSNRVGGNVVGGMGSLQLASTSRVGKDLVYWSQTADKAALSPGASVSGQIIYKPIPSQVEKWRDKVDKQTVKDSFNGAFHILRLTSFGGMVFLGFILIHFLPNLSYNTISLIEQKGWTSALVGLTTLILTPFVGVFLFFSLVGIPLALLLFILYGMALYVANIFFAYWLGARLLNRLEREASKTITFMIGAGIYFVLTSIVLIGPITMFMGLILGLGAMLLALKHTYLLSRKAAWV